MTSLRRFILFLALALSAAHPARAAAPAPTFTLALNWRDNADNETTF